MRKSALAYGVLVLSVSCTDAARPPTAGTRPATISGTAPPSAPIVAARPSPVAETPAPVGTPAPPQTSPLSSVPLAPPPDATEAEAALVWIADGTAQHGIKTYWLSSATGRAGGAVWISASREEPVTLTGSRLLAVRAKDQPLSTCDCISCEEGKCKSVAGSAARPALVDLETGASRPVLERLASPSCRTAPVDGVGADFQILSAVGPLLFLSENVWTQYCGAAHPMFQDEVHAIDVRTGRTEKVGASSEQIAALVTTARDALVEEHEGCMFEPDGPPDFYAATVGFGPGGALRGAFTFTFPAAYACGTGPGHYSVATTLERDDLPAIRPVVDVTPDWLTGALGMDIPNGIIQLPSKAPRDKLLATFRSAPVPAALP